MLPLPDGWGMLFVRSLPCCPKKEQHAAAHELLEESLRAYCHAHKRPVPALDFAYGEAGKPSLPSQPGLFFNLTHCEGLAACLVSDCECGVDADNLQTLTNTLRAIGYSYDRPIYGANGEVDMDASRRVSFRFIINLGTQS